MPEPLSPDRLAEIADSHPGAWYAGEWRSEYIDSTPDQPARYVVKHHETGTVLAELPDFAGPIALFVADAHEAVPALLADNQRLRQQLTRYRTAWRLARTRALSTGGAADRYAARAREGQTALQDMFVALLAAQMERDEAQAEVAALRKVLAKTPGAARPAATTQDGGQ